MLGAHKKSHPKVAKLLILLRLNSKLFWKRNRTRLNGFAGRLEPWKSKGYAKTSRKTSRLARHRPLKLSSTISQTACFCIRGCRLAGRRADAKVSDAKVNQRGYAERAII